MRIYVYVGMFAMCACGWCEVDGSQKMQVEFNFMCANDSSDEHLSDESTVRMANKVRHVGREDLQRSQKVRMHCPMMAAVPSDYSHPFQDSASSIWYDDFETKF